MMRWLGFSALGSAILAAAIALVVPAPPAIAQSLPTEEQCEAWPERPGCPGAPGVLPALDETERPVILILPEEESPGVYPNATGDGYMHPDNSDSPSTPTMLAPAPPN